MTSQVQTCVATVNSSALFGKDGVLKVHEVTVEDEFRFMRRVFYVAYMSILEEEMLDLEYMESDWFLGLREDFYFRYPSTIHDFETERKYRLQRVKPMCAWISAFMVKHDPTQIRLALKPTPTDTHETFQARYQKSTSDLVTAAWNQFKTDLGFVERYEPYTCAFCGDEFKSETSRVVRLEKFCFCDDMCLKSFAFEAFLPVLVKWPPRVVETMMGTI